MKIGSMFYKDIDRDIKGVIKIGRRDQENAFQELDEYVVTDEIASYMHKVLDAYAYGLTEKTDKMGIWISGFFGSGKSHFLKILSYILSNKEVSNPDDSRDVRKAKSFFLDDTKIPDKRLQDKIAKVADYAEDTDVIMFDISAKSASDSKSSKEVIKDIFMKVFNDHLGYCGSIPFLAEFERTLDDSGQYETFKHKFFEINGSSWESQREDYYFIQDDIVAALVELGIMSHGAAENWAANAENTYSLTAEKFAAIIQKYCLKKGERHHVVFLADEIGQYIADDTQLMLDLQAITHELGNACEGKAWIIVTSQQNIDSITTTLKTQQDNFSKIQGRFDTRVQLSSADVDEVIRKRLLLKTDEATAILKDLYIPNEYTIKNIITFSEGTTHLPLYEDADDFAAVYPFIPYQFKLLGEVLTAIRQYSSSGKNMSDRERTMLQQFQEAAKEYKNEREGVLVPFSSFYSKIEDNLDHTYRIVITGARKDPRLNEFDIDLLKVLFMVKHISGIFKANVENLTTLMITSINENTLELGKKVEASLRRLCDALLVQRTLDRYVFLTNEEQEAENFIRGISVDQADIIKHIAMVICDDMIALPNNKYSRDQRHQFSFNTRVDDILYKNSNASITLHILTAYSGEADDHALAHLSLQETSVIIRLSDDYPYIAETETMKKIETFLNKPELAELTDYKIIQANKQKERNELIKQIRQYITWSLQNAEFYVNGDKLITKSKDILSRVREAFEKLVDSVYSKLGAMESCPVESDIIDALKKPKAQYVLDLPGNKEMYLDAMAEIMEAVRYANATGTRFSLKQALDKFTAAPYGFLEVDVEYLVALLYKKGQISLKMNSVIYTPATETPENIYKYLTRKEYREKLLIELKEAPKTAWVKSVKRVLTDFFGRSIVSDDPDSLMRDFRTACSSKRSSLTSTLQQEYYPGSKLPGKPVVEKALRLIETVSSIEDPMTFFRTVDEHYEDFEEVTDDLDVVLTFLGGTQKEKYLKAERTLRQFKASENYISDETLLGYAKNVERILLNPSPYSYIIELEQQADLLGSALVDMLESRALEIEPQVRADQQLVLDQVDMDRPYATALRAKIKVRFDNLRSKLSTAKDLATISGIPLESSALIDSFNNEIAKEEEKYQKSLIPKQEEGEDEVVPVVKKPVVRTVPMSMHSLTKNKIYSIRTEADVDAFLRDMRKALVAELEENKIIRLS